MSERDKCNAKSKRHKVKETQKAKALHFAKLGNAKRKMVWEPNSLWQFGRSLKVWGKSKSESVRQQMTQMPKANDRKLENRKIQKTCISQMVGFTLAILLFIHKQKCK
jgi:hypothetical protein